MKNASFFLPTRVEFAPGILGRIAEMLKSTCTGSRVFVITDAGLIRAGVTEPILGQLKDHGYTVEVFDQVKPNPKDVDCEEGARRIREFNADMVLAIGGGSVMDTAKVVALLQRNTEPVVYYETRGRVTEQVTPLICVPTTAGTGSEVTRSAVITDTGRSFKMTIKEVEMAPALALVDPEITYHLPKALAASTGTDAFVHAIEAFTCKAANEFSDVWARAAMKKIFPNLRAAVLDGDYAAKDELMIGSTMAGVAFSHADVASVHCLAEALGGLYDTPHGVGNSIFLPAVTAFNSVADPVRHGEVARICGLADASVPDEEATEILVNELKQLRLDLGIPALKDVPGINPADFPRLAEASFQNGSTPDNCRDITTEDYLNLLNEVYAGN